MSNLQQQERIAELVVVNAERSLTSRQRAVIVQSVSSLKGLDVPIVVISRRPETSRFAAQIQAVVRQAGLNPKVSTAIGSSYSGLVITVHDSKDVPLAASVFADAFKASGLAFETFNDVTVPTFAIIVGEKPHVPVTK